MSNSTNLYPDVSIATAYFVANGALMVAFGYSQALQPDCQQTGVNQTATPDPSPSR